MFAVVVELRICIFDVVVVENKAFSFHRFTWFLEKKCVFLKLIGFFM